MQHRKNEQNVLWQGQQEVRKQKYNILPDRVAPADNLFLVNLILKKFLPSFLIKFTHQVALPLTII